MMTLTNNTMRKVRGKAAAHAGALGAATAPQLPAPGLTGLALAREARGAVVQGTIRDDTSRTNPGAAGVTSRPTGILVGALPFGRNLELSEPLEPTTADPVRRYVESPKARHARLYPRMPDVGGTQPWQGMRITPRGGIPRPPAATLEHVKMPAPADVASKKVNPRAIRQLVAEKRHRSKPVTVLRPGLGGLDVAMGRRLVPDTPSGVREAIRDVRAKRLHGAMSQHQTAPAAIVQARAAAVQMLMGAANVTPTAGGAEPDAVRVDASKPPRLVPSAMVPTPALASPIDAQADAAPASSSSSWLPLAAAAAALVFMFRG